ncbi:MAG TPA: hypothetical protein VE033_16620 [Acetobacteraceae bacterium]|jgi:hypothetical protein|nr:hypothetical protein [Acetobacteraceae bacterium]
MGHGVRVAAGLLAAVMPLSAEAGQPRDRTWFGTVYVGQWVNGDMADIPRRAVTGSLGWEPATFASLIAHRVLVPEIRSGWPLIGRIVDGGSLELEGQFGRHFGLQRHAEVSLSLVWRSPDVTVPLTDARVNVAFAEGLSYALSRPTLEGREAEDGPQKFLNYLGIEFEVSHPALPGISLVPRLHHRSGIFGLIAPHGGTGSNFLGLGLRMTLQ